MSAVRETIAMRIDSLTDVANEIRNELAEQGELSPASAKRLDSIEKDIAELKAFLESGDPA